MGEGLPSSQLDLQRFERYYDYPDLSGIRLEEHVKYDALAGRGRGNEDAVGTLQDYVCCQALEPLWVEPVIGEQCHPVRAFQIGTVRVRVS
jgi:hypothetical protein